MPLNLPMRISLLFLLCIFIVSSCKTDSSGFFNNSSTFLGGEIINPKSNNVILYDKNGAIDTIELNQNNKFFYELTDAKSGLYYFKHSHQRQNIFIEPGDSLLIRLNTYEFDESLAFSGKGDTKNNFLMDMFLLNEENDKKFSELIKLPPKQFETTAEKMWQESKRKLQRILNKEEYSSDFIYLATKAVDYEYYDLKERYYFLTMKFSPKTLSRFQDDYFDYRKDVNFNDDKLDQYYGYLRYLDRYIKNVTITSCLEANEESCYTLNTTNNTIRRLHVADSVLKISSLRNIFLQGISSTGILTAYTIEGLNEILNTLDNIDVSADIKDNLTQAAVLQIQYISSKTIGERRIVSAASKDTIKLKEIVDKPTVIITWTLDQPQQQLQYHKHLEKLSKKFPDYDFMAVNIDEARANEWSSTLERYSYNLSQEYKLFSFKETPDKLKERTRLVLILDEDCNVMNRSINFMDDDFIETLKSI